MKTTLFTFVGAAVVAAALLAFVGCETEKLSDTQLSITPSSATVAPGKSVVLTASGGWDYTWKIVQGNGSLSAYNGKKVTYTASEKSYPSSSSGNSTTNTSYTYKGVMAKAETTATTSTAIVSVFSGGHEATATITIKE